MTSAINPSTISVTYPVAGKDNDSQGFRDNFAAIASNFTTAKTEITAVQTVALLSADLATQSTPVVNNLLGSTISNGLYQQFSGTYYTASGVSTTANIDLSLGAVQKFTLSGNAVLTFDNWPAYSGSAGVYSNAVVLIESNGNGVYSPTFAASGGNISYDTAFPSTFSVGGESVASVSVTEAGTGYTGPVTIGFSGGSPITNAVTPTATATYSVVQGSVANLASTSIATTGASGTGSTATLTFSTQLVAPYVVGQSIVVTGVLPSGYNGVHVVTACTTTSVSFSSTTQGSQTSAGAIYGGVAGNGYAVGDQVKIVGQSGTTMTVATLATTLPGTLTSGQPYIGNVPASYITNLYAGQSITGVGIPAATTISSIGSISGGVFSITMSANATSSGNTTVTYVSSTGPIGTLSGTPVGTLSYPLTNTLYQLETITGFGTGARVVANCGIAGITLTNSGIGYTTTPPTITISGSGTGATALATLTSNTSSKTKVIEAWTINSGVTVNIRYLGQY